MLNVMRERRKLKVRRDGLSTEHDPQEREDDQEDNDKDEGKRPPCGTDLIRMTTHLV